MVSMMFLAGVALLLATPGPTNSLLATAGAAAGWRPAPKLLAAELVAYQISVVAAGLALQPLFGHAPEARLTIQGAAAVYLLSLAWRLWRHGHDAGAAAVIGPRQVGTTTLLNPKGLIIALGLMPEAAWSEPATLVAHLAALALMTPLFGGLWLGVGVIGGMAAGARASSPLPRVAAAALCLFAGILAHSALAS